MKKYKILICGGHPSPAIAVIEELSKEKIFDIFYVGRAKASARDNNFSWEYQQVKDLKIKFYNLAAGKLQRTIGFSALISIFRIPYGFWQAFTIIRQEKPDIVVSFGGYIALPLVIWARFFNIPALSHEQTFKVGLANRIISIFADTFCISWEQTRSQINHSNLVLTGNPIRNGIISPKKPSFSDLNLDKFPIIYITGGGLGSHFINVLLKESLNSLLKNFIVIHQCGDASEFKDYEKLLNLKKMLPESLKQNYFVFKHLKENDIGWIYKNAILLVGRSGANTITEILLSHLPAILIPLPWSGENEQIENALMLKSLGVAEVLDQRKINSEVLLATINSAYNEIIKYKTNFTPQTDKLIKPNGDKLLVKEIKKLLLK